MKQKLPIGIQDFAKIREGNFRYVDKTALIYNFMINFDHKSRNISEWEYAEDAA